MEKEIENHVEEGKLEAYAMNALAGSELVRVEEHLLFCETCQDQLQTVERYVLAMQGAAMRVRQEEKQAPSVSRNWSRFRALLQIPVPIWCGAAAMAVLIVIIGLNFRQSPGSPIDVELLAVRGDSTGTAPAGHSLRLRLDNQGVQYLPAWRIEIVNSEGASVWSGTGDWSDTAIKATVPKSFTPGTYYVRLLKEMAQDPAREYQLVVH